ERADLVRNRLLAISATQNHALILGLVFAASAGPGLDYGRKPESRAMSPSKPSRIAAFSYSQQFDRADSFSPSRLTSSSMRKGLRMKCYTLRHENEFATLSLLYALARITTRSGRSRLASSNTSRLEAPSKVTSSSMASIRVSCERSIVKAAVPSLASSTEHPLRWSILER